MLSYVLFFFLYFKDRPIFYSYSFSLFSPTCYMALVLRIWITLRSTEPRGRVVNNLASYSEGPGFDSRPRPPAILIEVFRGFS
jgi:hypothetical protein